MKYIKTILLWGVIIVLVDTFVINLILGIIQRTANLSLDAVKILAAILDFGSALYLARQSIIRIPEKVSQGNAIMIGLFESIVAAVITFIPFIGNGVDPLVLISVLVGGSAGGYLASKK